MCKIVNKSDLCRRRHSRVGSSSLSLQFPQQSCRGRQRRGDVKRRAGTPPPTPNRFHPPGGRTAAAGDPAWAEGTVVLASPGQAEPSRPGRRRSARRSSLSRSSAGRERGRDCRGGAGRSPSVCETAVQTLTSSCQGMDTLPVDTLL